VVFTSRAFLMGGKGTLINKGIIMILQRYYNKSTIMFSYCVLFFVLKENSGKPKLSTKNETGKKWN